MILYRYIVLNTLLVTTTFLNNINNIFRFAILTIVLLYNLLIILDKILRLPILLLIFILNLGQYINNILIIFTDYDTYYSLNNSILFGLQHNIGILNRYQLIIVYLITKHQPKQASKCIQIWSINNPITLFL